MKSFECIIGLLTALSVLTPLAGTTFRVVRKLVQVLSVPIFGGCIVLLEGFNLGKFRVVESTKKRYPQETFATIHLISTALILNFWYNGIIQKTDITKLNSSLQGLYIFNIVCLGIVLLISRFSNPPENEKDWIDKLLDYKFSLGFYKNLTE